MQASPPPETSVFPEMELLTPSPVPPPAQAQVGLGLCFGSGIFYSESDPKTGNKTFLLPIFFTHRVDPDPSLFS
jgi:hypothetical protein